QLVHSRESEIAAEDPPFARPSIAEILRSTDQPADVARIDRSIETSKRADPIDVLLYEVRIRGEDQLLRPPGHHVNEIEQRHRKQREHGGHLDEPPHDEHRPPAL